MKILEEPREAKLPPGTCYDCGTRAAVLVEIRMTHQPFASIEAHNIQLGLIQPRRVCPACARSLSTTPDEHLGVPSLSRVAPEVAPPPPSAIAGREERVKPPRKSGDGDNRPPTREASTRPFGKPDTKPPRKAGDRPAGSGGVFGRVSR